MIERKDTNPELAALIRERKEALGFTWKALGDACGVSPQGAQSWSVTGQARAKHIGGMAKVLQVERSQLWSLMERRGGADPTELAADRAGLALDEWEARHGKLGRRRRDRLFAYLVRVLLEASADDFSQADLDAALSSFVASQPPSDRSS